MDIPYSFFEDEVRDGFFIPTFIKHGWAAQMLIYEEIKRICDKYHLRIFADCGSLLGAIRHKGFIPWDDDFDTAMLRDDLTVFNEVAEKELQPPFHLVTIHTDENDIEFTTYVCTEDLSPDDNENLEKFYGFPVRTGVDIFPLDYISPDRNFEEQRKSLIFELNWLEERVQDKEGIIANEENIKAIEAKYNTKIDRDGNVRHQLLLIEEMLATVVPPEESEEVVLLPYWVGHGNHVHNKHWFDETVSVPFEFTTVPVPRGYDNVLKVEYGDYMTIYRNGGKHNYPAFSNRFEKWKEKYGIIEYEIPKAPYVNNVNESKESAKGSYFFPYREDGFRKMFPFILKSIEDGDPVHIVPISVYYKDFRENMIGTGQTNITKEDFLQEFYDFAGEHLSIEFLNENIIFHKEADFDTAHLNAHQIFIQFPYDDTNSSWTVDEKFFAEKLVEHTEKLTYVPPFTLRDFTPDDFKEMKNFQYVAETPAVYFADEIIVHSEQMRDMLAAFLAQQTGEENLMHYFEKISVVTQ